jgi:hypothetical protein
MKTLKKFSEFALNKNEERMIKGGETAYCTNGMNARCYYYFDDATNACMRDLGCNRIELIQV